MPNKSFKTPSRAEEYVETTNTKISCRVATTENITLSGIQTISNVTLVINDRVLVKDQTDASENGIDEDIFDLVYVLLKVAKGTINDYQTKRLMKIITV